MSEIIGRLTICDRCGEKVFSKYTGEGELDGGYTRWNKFEDLPDGWDFHSETGRLCPKCNGEYIDLIKKFKSRGADNGA